MTNPARLDFPYVAAYPQFLNPNKENSLPIGVSVNTFVKIPQNSAVYFIGDDNARHAFPLESLYFSWVKDFSLVKEIPLEQISKIPLKKNMSLKPFTKLIKIQTDPKVYEVIDLWKLKWIETEEEAIVLYGIDWSKKVIDLPVEFFFDYEIVE